MAYSVPVAFNPNPPACAMDPMPPRPTGANARPTFPVSWNPHPMAILISPVASDPNVSGGRRNPYNDFMPRSRRLGCDDNLPSGSRSFPDHNLSRI